MSDVGISDLGPLTSDFLPYPISHLPSPISRYSNPIIPHPPHRLPGPGQKYVHRAALRAADLLDAVAICLPIAHLEIMPPRATVVLPAPRVEAFHPSRKACQALMESAEGRQRTCTAVGFAGRAIIPPVKDVVMMRIAPLTFRNNTL